MTVEPDRPGERVLTVRKALASDRLALIALNRELQVAEAALRPSRIAPEALPDSYIDDLLQRQNDGGGGVAVASDGSALAGFVAWREDSDQLEADPREVLITDLVVAAGHRRRGIARALIGDAIRRAAVHGVGRVLVTTLTNNRPALAAYEAMGFQPVLTTLELAVEPDSTEPGVL